MGLIQIEHAIAQYSLLDNVLLIWYTYLPDYLASSQSKGNTNGKLISKLNSDKY